MKATNEGKEIKLALKKTKEELASHIKKAQGMLEELSMLTDKDVEKRGGLAVIKTLITNIEEELVLQVKMVRQMCEELSRLADKKEALP